MIRPAECMIGLAWGRDISKTYFCLHEQHLSKELYQMMDPFFVRASVDSIMRMQMYKAMAANFSHIDWLHLARNMIGLFVFGRTVCQALLFSLLLLYVPQSRSLSESLSKL